MTYGSSTYVLRTYVRKYSTKYLERWGAGIPKRLEFQQKEKSQKFKELHFQELEHSGSEVFDISIA